MESAAQRGKLRAPKQPGAGTAIGAEDVLFLVRKVGWAGLWHCCNVMQRCCRATYPPCTVALCPGAYELGWSVTKNCLNGAAPLLGADPVRSQGTDDQEVRITELLITTISCHKLIFAVHIPSQNSLPALAFFPPGPQEVRSRQGAADRSLTHVPPCPGLLHSCQDPKKYARAKELLIMDEEIRKARQVVEDEEVARAVA